MKTRTKKSGFNPKSAAPQPDGCVSCDTTILARKDWLVTLAKVSIGLGVILMLALGGKLDTELLTGVSEISIGQFALTIGIALTAMLTGTFAVYRLDGAEN